MFNLNKKYEKLLEMYTAQTKLIVDAREKERSIAYRYWKHEDEIKDLKAQVMELTARLNSPINEHRPVNYPTNKPRKNSTSVLFRTIRYRDDIKKGSIVNFTVPNQLYRVVGSLVGRDSYVFELVDYPGISLVIVNGHDLCNGDYKVLEVTNG